MKRIAILGSTGSIGEQTLDVVHHLPGEFEVIALAAGTNASLLSHQIDEFSPRFAFLQSGASLSISQQTFQLLPLEEMACHPEVDLVVVATTGASGLLPTLAALQAGKRVALANKEVLVMAGEIIMAEARKHHAEILPLDSEHSAIWQCLRGEQKGEVSRLILTASGGPFRHYTTAQLVLVTPEEALHHPTWKMGRKVTIDSATLMNKGLEIIEAHWLFDIPWEHISVVLRPESIIHSMVEFVDGSLKAQLGVPDMRLPIQYALCYPTRKFNPTLSSLDWDKLRSLTFQPPDYARFPCLNLAAKCGKRGGTYPTVLCAADEVAVNLFLHHEIGFRDIPLLVERVVEQHQSVSYPSLNDILEADSWAREEATKLGSKGKGSG